MNSQVIDELKNSEDPSIRYLLHRDYLGSNLQEVEMLKLRNEIKDSPQVKQLLADRADDGRFPRHAYAKWKGAFWVLLQLADLGYPSGDASLAPLRDQVLDWLLDEGRLKRIPLIQGRYRRCALQEAAIVYSMVKLDLVNEAAMRQLIDLLLKWQWPDGGWNCDKKPTAIHSSFHESLIPLRAMNAFAEFSGDEIARTSVERTSEIFLSRRMFRRLEDGSIMDKDFVHLRYPPYWHYDILTGLTVMYEIGRLKDSRCSEALDLLESKQLPVGGWSAEIKYYKVSAQEGTGVSPVAWGPVGSTRRNEYVTVRALGVLRHAGRL